MKIFANIVVGAALTAGAAMPLHATISYFNYAATESFVGGAPTYSFITSTADGSPAIVVGASADGFGTAQAASTGGGTAIATASALAQDHFSFAEASYGSIFDVPTTVTGRVNVKVSGWVNATGSGYAAIQTFIRVGSISFRSGVYSAAQDMPLVGIAAAPGLRKLSVSKTFNWRGGNSITVSNDSTADAFGEIYGPGFASAYIDPVITISAVPEPASWALLIAGFGMTGAALRRQRQSAVL